MPHKIEVIEMKKWIFGIMTLIAGCSSAFAIDSVCLNDPNCIGDKVNLVNSTPSFFMVISSNGIQFGDGSVQTTAGGAAGGGSASFFTFTDNSGNKTAISSMTFPVALFNRIVSGSSITITLNPSSITMLGSGLEYYQSGSLVGSATSFVLGTNLSGSMSGRILTLSATGGSGGSDNFGTHTASKVIDAAGFALTRVSSIVFNSGTSPIIAGMISSAAANTIVDATQINATNKGTNKLLGMNADNTLSFFTDQTSAGGGDNYGNHVATMPQVSAFAVTVASGTVYGQLSVGSITVNSAGAGVINSTHAVMKIKVTNLSDDDFEVAEDSVSVNGVKVSTDQHNTPGVLNNKTYDATLIGNVFTSSRSVSWGAILTSSLSIITQTSSKTVGMAQFRNAISSEANCGYGVPWRAPAGITGTPTGNLMIRGGSTGTQRYVVGFASVPVNLDVQFATITTAVVNFDFPTDAGGTAEGARVLSNVPLTGITFIPGDWYQPVYCRDGDAAQDASSTDSYGARFSMDYQVSQ